VTAPCPPDCALIGQEARECHTCRKILRGLHVCVPYAGVGGCFTKLGDYQTLQGLEMGVCAICGEQALGVPAHLAARPEVVLAELRRGK